MASSKSRSRTVIFNSIKLTRSVYNQLQSTLSDVNKKGWKHLGATRDDRPTMSTLIEEALGRLNGKKV